MFSYQTKPEKKRSAKAIQPKLKIGQPGDKYEREADAVAERVMRMNDSDTMQMQPIEEEEEEMVQMIPLDRGSNLLQMKCADCEEEEMLQPKFGLVGGFVSPNVSQYLQRSKGSGTALPPTTNQFMSNAIGRDFSGVRIHNGLEANKMNMHLGARAFTHSNNIYFNNGEYNPESTNGKSLLAHELTHVVQQGSVNGLVQRDLAVEPPLPEAAQMGLLDDEEVSAALHYNLDRFANAAELSMIRDVLGLAPDAEHLINEEFVQSVASWQAMHDLEDIDGKLGVDTVRTLVDEYRGEASLVPEMNTRADRLAIRTRSNERANNVDVNGHNDLFDAVLSHRNANLTLVMRIDFQFHAGATGTVATADQQRQFIRRFENDVRNIWTEMYALVPDGPQPANYLDTYYAEIDIQNSNVNPHFVAHIGSTTSSAQSTDPPGVIASGGPAAHSDQRWLRMGTSDVGLATGTSVQNTPMSQYTAAHEFGHMLGMSHIHCDTNNAQCYGTTDAERANIMGLGNRVTRSNYAPFLAAMRAITGSSWKVR